ncbi:DoxX family protein [Nonlabens ponticola]|uniref:DoxX family protein n=1 Tax=Nonlabens ponticola TaxID=2496866 RepID=A0A3S9MYZ8_9FLAO|nr:DoxX family protein [Nonlabens ponticola]AZQ44378.1 hypothetical protein EJ995_09045 [Nonlabens ponticola]
MKLLEILTYFSAISFFFFGITCLVTPHMKLEFTRFGLTTRQRQLTGVLQLIGAAGLLFYQYNIVVTMAAAAGLSLLMLLGFYVRLKIKDSIYQSSPALIYMLLNALIVFQIWQGL